MIELSETPVREAIRKLSWQILTDHLAETSLTEKDVEKLVGLVRRSDALVLKRLDQKKQKIRDAFLENISVHLLEKGYSEQAGLVRAHALRLNEIDNVYQSIIQMLAKTGAAKLSPELRVSALLERSNREYVSLLEEMHKNLPSGGVLDLGKIAKKSEDGIEFNAEGVHELLISTLESTLGMEAHIHGWYDAEGVLVLPELPIPADQDLFAVGSVQILAAAWRNWQFSERRYRYLGAPLDRIEDPSPEWAAHGIRCLWSSRPSDDLPEIYSNVANVRLAERLLHQWLATITSSRYAHVASGISGEVGLLPRQVVSLQELHIAAALSQILSGEITEDPSEYAGLTLAEWVRGYSVLQYVADKALKPREAEGLTIRFTDAELVELLERLGLRGGKAQAFIGHATYRKASRDLFDQPLIKLEGGGYLLLAIAIASSSIPRVILSTLGMLEVNLDGRGKRFENRMIELLSKYGIKAKNIICDRGGETYDYDVAFVWGDYLFLFECKSRGLSGGDPARTYYFSLGIRQVVKQVTRLANGIQQHPDILTTHMPDAVGKQVVYCVVNSMPYATCTEEGSIHFADESGIAMFFKGAVIGPQNYTRETGVGPIDAASAVMFLWDGDEPTPEDFLRYLRTPIQVVNAVHHMELTHVDLHVGEGNALRLVEFLHTDRTLDSLREAAREAGYRVGGDLVVSTPTT